MWLVVVVGYVVSPLNCWVCEAAHYHSQTEEVWASNGRAGPQDRPGLGWHPPSLPRLFKYFHQAADHLYSLTIILISRPSPTRINLVRTRLTTNNNKISVNCLGCHRPQPPVEMFNWMFPSPLLSSPLLHSLSCLQLKYSQMRLDEKVKILEAIK